MPIHPYLVHFPIAFFFLEAVLIFIGHLRKENRYEEFSFFVLKAAMLTMPFVMAAGYFDAGAITSKVRWHFFSALLLFFVNGFRLVLRWKAGSAIWNRAPRAALALLGFSLLLTTITGHLGGMIVHH